MTEQPTRVINRMRVVANTTIAAAADPDVFVVLEGTPGTVLADGGLDVSDRNSGLVRDCGVWVSWDAVLTNPRPGDPAAVLADFELDVPVTQVSFLGTYEEEEEVAHGEAGG